MICNFKTKVWLLCYVNVSPNYMIHPPDTCIYFSVGAPKQSLYSKSNDSACFVYKLSSVWFMMNLSSPIKAACTAWINTLLNCKHAGGFKRQKHGNFKDYFYFAWCFSSKIIFGWSKNRKSNFSKQHREV